MSNLTLSSHPEVCFNWNLALTKALSGFCLSHQSLHALVVFVKIFAKLKAYIRSDVLFERSSTFHTVSWVPFHFHHHHEQLHPDYCKNLQSAMPFGSEFKFQMKLEGNIFQISIFASLEDTLDAIALYIAPICAKGSVALLFASPKQTRLHTPSGASNLTLHLLPGACKRRIAWYLWFSRCGHWSISQQCSSWSWDCQCRGCGCVPCIVLPSTCNRCSCWRLCICLCGRWCIHKVSAHWCSCIGWCGYLSWCCSSSGACGLGRQGRICWGRCIW